MPLHFAGGMSDITWVMPLWVMVVVESGWVVWMDERVVRSVRIVPMLCERCQGGLGMSSVQVGSVIAQGRWLVVRRVLV